MGWSPPDDGGGVDDGGTTDGPAGIDGATPDGSTPPGDAVDVATGSVSTLVGRKAALGFVDGPSGTASFYRAPHGLTLDAAGTKLYLTDQWNYAWSICDERGVDADRQFAAPGRHALLKTKGF